MFNGTRIVLVVLAHCLSFGAGAQDALPEGPKSPLDTFRAWLELPAAEVERALAAKSEEQKSYLLAKIKEFRGLPIEAREARLRALEFRWYMRPLMEILPSARAARLAQVPQALRQLIAQRLDQWDLLPPEIHREVLDNEWAISYFTPSPPLPTDQPGQTIRAANVTPGMEEKIARWQSLSQGARARMTAQFNGFFELPAVEQEKTLDGLDDSERGAMEKTLKAFERLPPEQRRACINSFNKFATLSPRERGLFLRNVERWQAMSPQDRSTWRNLVSALPPVPPLSASLPPSPLGR